MRRFRGLRGKQLACFSEIARGRNERHHPRTLAALAEKGLIAFETKRFVLDGLGTLYLDVPYVPKEIHQDWCIWRADNGTSIPTQNDGAAWTYKEE